MYLRNAVASSRDWRRHLCFLLYFDVNKAHFVIALLLDPRYTRLTLQVDYARIYGTENIPHIKGSVKAYLDVLIEWLQSLCNSMHGHTAFEDSQERGRGFRSFEARRTDAAQVESTVRKEFSLYQRTA